MTEHKHVTHLSKFLSLILRHKPEVVGISLDHEGWVSVSELLDGLQWIGKPISREELDHAVLNNDKQRFAFSEDGARIRASQGHSLPVNLGLKPMIPPDTLYHGTVARNLPMIMRGGLLKRSRHHVHLSISYQIAMKVGGRRGPAVVLVVKSREMSQDGFLFFRAENGVWLTDQVPSEYLLLVGSHTDDK